MEILRSRQVTITRRGLLAAGGTVLAALATGEAVRRIVGGGQEPTQQIKQIPEQPKLTPEEELVSRHEHLKSLYPDTEPIVYKIWTGEDKLPLRYPPRSKKEIEDVTIWPRINDGEPWYRIIDRIMTQPPFASLSAISSEPLDLYTSTNTYLTVPKKGGLQEKAYITDLSRYMSMRTNKDKPNWTPYRLEKDLLAVRSFPFHFVGHFEDQMTNTFWSFFFISEAWMPKYDYVFVGADYHKDRGWRMPNETYLVLRRIKIIDRKGPVEPYILVTMPNYSIGTLAIWLADKDGVLTGYDEVSSFPRVSR